MKLASSKFRFDNHCLRHGVANITDWIDVNSLKESLTPVGWCNGSDLEWKPNSYYHGLMVFDSELGEEYWSHVTPHTINTHFPGAIKKDP